MRKSLLFFCPLFFGSIFLFVDKTNDEIAIANSYEQQRASNAIGCAPTVDEFNMNATGKFIPVMPGWGNYSYTITTNNDSAQLYFNQGLLPMSHKSPGFCLPIHLPLHLLHNSQYVHIHD